MALRHKILISAIIISLSVILHQVDGFLGGNSFKLLRPDQIRLALVPNGMVVSWQTFAKLGGSNPNLQPTVKYGLSENALTSTSTDGYTSIYDRDDPLYTSYFYNIRLNNLIPSTTYYYQIAESTYVSESKVYSFRTAPEAGDPSRQVNITILGDLGVEFLLSAGNAFLTRKALEKMIPVTDFFIHSGDISYADDTPTYELSYNTWQSDMAPITRVRPYMTCAGNHEASCRQISENGCPSDLRNYSAYFHRFRMPGPESGGYMNIWWSQDYGMVHVIAIDTETDFADAPSDTVNTYPANGNFLDDNAQLNWLKADLVKANANRAKVPWIVVTGHRPWVSTVSTQSLLPNTIVNCPQCKAVFEPLFNEYHVDFYVAGHIHWYERFCPSGVDCAANPNLYTNPQGPIYITNGGAGNSEGLFAPVRNTIPANSVKLISKAGFGQLLFPNRNTAIWNFYLSTNPNQPADSFTVSKS